MKKLLTKAHVKSMLIKERMKDILASNKGEGFIDTALKILISVVIGGLILTGLYLLFQNTILPTLEQKIIEMFDFNG